MKCMLLACVCGEEYLLKEVNWGHVGKCARCARVFRIPLPDAAGRIADSHCPSCGNTLALGDSARGEIFCPCGQHLTIPHVVEVDDAQPRSKQLAEARRQVAETGAPAAKASPARVAPQVKQTPVHRPADTPLAAPSPSVLQRAQSGPPANSVSQPPAASTAPATARAGTASNPKPPSREPRPALHAPRMAPPVSPSPRPGSPLGSPAPAAAGAPPPALPAGFAPPTLPATFRPPALPTAFAPPPLPAAGGTPGPGSTPAVSSAAPPSLPLGANAPPPVPSLPPLPATLPGRGVRGWSRRQVKWIVGSVATAVAALAVAFPAAGFLGSPARQVHVTAQWETGSDRSRAMEVETLQVRLSINNRSSKPIFIEPTQEELFATETGSDSRPRRSGSDSSGKKSFLERLADQAAEDAMGDMQGMEEWMGMEGLEESAAEQLSAKSVFSIQVAVGNQDKWNALSRHQLREDRGEDSERNPQTDFGMYRGSGWTIAPQGVLELLVPVRSRPKGNQPQYNPRYGLAPGTAAPIPNAIRVRAVRASDKARLPELTVSLPSDLGQAWTKES